MSTKSNPSQDAVAANRRRQLAKWINDKCGGSQTVFIASTNDGKKQLNQGELSALLKNKSFGEKRARSLEVQAGMPVKYLEEEEESVTGMPVAKQATYAENIRPVSTIRWPFKHVSYGRLMSLQKALGPKVGHEAIIDISKTLDVIVSKWEREVTQRKSSKAG